MRSERPAQPAVPFAGVVGLALLVLLGGVDLHGSTLNYSTFETPHPVFHVCGDTSQSEHVEAAESALIPAHEPALRTRWLALAVEPVAHEHRLPRPTGERVPLSVDTLRNPADGRSASPRGPPFA